VQYSASSQLIGHRIMVRLYPQQVECWLGGQCVLSLPRATSHGGQRHPRHIDYRHLVAALKRKPGAFARWMLRDAVFPRTCTARREAQRFCFVLRLLKELLRNSPMAMTSFPSGVVIVA
jgi:hypothetical protein